MKLWYLVFGKAETAGRDTVRRPPVFFKDIYFIQEVLTIANL